MGCGQSKPATPEEEQEICKVNGKDMCSLCLKVVLEHTDKIDVQVPSQMDQVRDAFKVKLDEMKAARAEAGGGEDAAAEEGAAEGGDGAGGMLGQAMGWLSKAADEANKVLVKAGDMTEDVLLKAMEEALKAMDAAIAKINEPLKSVGQDIFATHKVKIIKSMKEHIDKMDFPEARQKTVDGGPTDCTAFAWTDTSAIVKVLRETEGIEDAIKKQKAVEAWDTFGKQYNLLKEQFATVVELPPCDLDMTTYICEQTIATIGKMMNTEEEAFRKNPNNSYIGRSDDMDAEFPDIFEKVFTMARLNQECRDEAAKKGKEVWLTQNEYNTIIKRKSRAQ